MVGDRTWPEGRDSVQALRRSLRRPEDVRIVGSLASLIAAALLIVAAAVYLGSVRQDALQHANEERLVTHSVNSLQRALTTTVRDYAWWSEAVRSLVLDLNEDWADINIGPYVYSTFGYEMALVVDGDDHPIRGLAAGVRARRRLQPAALGDMLPHCSPRRGDGRSGYEPIAVSGYPARRGRASGCRRQSDRAAAGLRDAVAPGPTAMLVFGKWLDDAFLATVGTDFGLSHLAIVRLMPTSLRNSLRSICDGPDGANVAQIVWQPWHPGRTQRAWLLPALLASLVVFTLFTQVVLRSIRRATTVVRQSEARFRDIAEAASDWIWETDHSLVLTYVSEPFVGATGLKPGDVLGQPLDRLLEPCDAKLRAQYAANLAANQPFRNIVCVLACAAARTPVR